MSGVAIINYKLANDAALTAVVPAAWIFSGIAPIGTALPAISITQISGVSPHDPVAAPGNMIRERVQVTVECKEYPQTKVIMTLIRNAFSTYSRATVSGFNCDSVMQDTEGPDLYDQETGIYAQSTDFIVRWIY